jgi:hypothetical protein
VGLDPTLQTLHQNHPVLADPLDHGSRGRIRKPFEFPHSDLKLLLLAFQGHELSRGMHACGALVVGEDLLGLKNAPLA